MMLLAKSSEYAIRMVMYLLHHPTGEFTPIKEIAGNTGISFYRLGKVAQQLTKARILKSYTGPNGGVRLADTSDQFSLHDIVVATEGPDVFDGCVLGIAECGGDNLCCIHHHWKEVREKMLEVFQDKTLEEVVDYGMGSA